MQQTPRATHRFPKSVRLRSRSQFDRVFRERCSRADQRIVVYACKACHGADSLPGPRLGLVVSRKCGNAVVRNRWKRALREAFRLAQHDLPPGVDFVVLPRPKAIPQVAPLQASLKRLCWQLQRKLTVATRPPRCLETDSGGGKS